jgi:DNA-binding CsgD family transcriptional regulator
MVSTRKKGNAVGSSLTRPGLIVVDGALGVIAYNTEAVQILSFPDPLDKVRQVDSYLSNKIRTDLTNRQSPPKFLDSFRSAKRTYVCRSFSLELKGHQSNGSGSAGGLLIVILERKSNGSTKLTELSERFGLTAREHETVQYLLQGLTSKEIAQRMKISPNTVKAFLRLVMVKMNVSTRSGIIGRIVGPAA